MKEYKPLSIMSEKEMSNLTHLFKTGQKVRCDMDGKFHNGIVKETYADHIIVDVPGISDHCWFENGLNIGCVYPEYNFKKDSHGGRETYEFKCLLSEEYSGYDCHDEWGCAMLLLNDVEGVEYNFCTDNGTNSSAIYRINYYKEYDAIETDHDTFEHYEIDFSNINWKKDLEKAMYKAAKKFSEQDRVKKTKTNKEELSR